MRITCTNGNKRNKISGSRVSVYASDGQLVDRFAVPAHYGTRYCREHPAGRYGMRYLRAIAKVAQIDAALAQAKVERSLDEARARATQP